MYVIYNPKRNNQVERIPGNGVGVMKSAQFRSEGAAKACLTRMRKKVAEAKLSGRRAPSWCADVADLVIASQEDYRELDTTVEKECFMTGEKFTESVNTPYSCSRASETYWSS